MCPLEFSFTIPRSRVDGEKNLDFTRFFIGEIPALRHRFRTREKLHLQAVKVIPQADHEKQAEI